MSELAYDSGCIARLSGVRYNDNPFPYGSEERQEWDNGYLDTMREQNVTEFI